jgi:glucose/mannose-6-phosphate isomerase
MNLLDDIAKIREIDKSNAGGSIEAFPDQLKDIWQQMGGLKFSENLKNFKNIVLTGMGGSALAGRIVKHLYQDKLRVSFEVNTEYSLPEYADHQSLIIVSSYSGNTEETLSCLEEALVKKAKIVALTTNGRLEKYLARKRISGLVFRALRNPLGYPKTAIGYSLGGLLAIFSSLKLIELDNRDFLKSLNDFGKTQEKFLLNQPQKMNPAKKLALKLKGLIPFIVASQHLKGAAYSFRNQLHEIDHSQAFFFDLPELNHHLIEALKKPDRFRKEIGYLLIHSDHYHPQNLKRYQAWSDLLKKEAIKTFNYYPQTKDRLAQVLEIINLGGFISFYLSILDREDPGPESLLIEFKKRLGQPTH